MFTTFVERIAGVARRATLLVAPLALLLTGPTAAEKVDAEFLLLVDVSDVVTGSDFNDLLSSYAQAFESGPVVNVIENDGIDGLAASVVFLGGGTEVVAVPWTKITDAASAQAFANALRSASRPALYSTTSIASGLDFATQQFGTETGHAGNGFESTHQAITVTSETQVPVGGSPLDVLTARDAALGSGVDVIHGITVGTTGSGLAQAYYDTFVVGGQVWGQAGYTANSPDYASLPSDAAGALQNQLLFIVPEPAAGLMSAFALGLLGLRRRRG